MAAPPNSKEGYSMITLPRVNDESDMENFTGKFQRMIRRDTRSIKRNFIPKQACDEYESIVSLMAKSDPDSEDEKVKNETDGRGGSVSSGNCKKGFILGVDNVGKTLAHAIENVYFVNGLKYSLLSVSQICDRRNEVKFLPCSCTVTSLKTGEMVLVSKRFKNVYVTDFGSQDRSDLTYLSAIEEDPELWHRRLGHASFLLLNKLAVKDLVRELPKVKLKDHNACIRRKQFDNFCIENGISHNFSAPRTPQQNGAVERKNRTLENMARTMLIASWVTKSFCAEAVNTTYHVINRCMIRSLLEKTPYELLNGRKPKLTYLRAFSCKCFILNNNKEALGKFDAKSDKGIFLEYSSYSKAYKVYNKRTQTEEESVHVIFDESSCQGDIRVTHDEEEDGVFPKFLDKDIEISNEKTELMNQIKLVDEENVDNSQ
ncbi:uncharacterized protein LOC132039507 [Lycium ferocissimum]|uniref:uncharacterized protein LOC132039507 n=1 Tax=Lycium ferocissimum TaxID=112874 RepID=UPI0028164B05|nr:uncharacterized protein LOC132039507 [Lycium ferocissimum]